MASASVVGQHPGPGPHRLDTEPQLLVFKLNSSRKKITPPRKSSWEKMMFKRSSGCSGETGRSHSWSQISAGEPASRRETIPGEGCFSPAGPGETCSPDRVRHDGSTGFKRRVGTGGSRTGCHSRDCNSNVHCDPNRNTAHRRESSLKTQDCDVIPNGSVRNGLKGGHESVLSAESAPDMSSGLPLDRLTQSRTGVVKLIRTEPPRTEAWSIFPRGMDPRVRTERGEGHRFQTQPVTRDWCDACSCQIFAQALKCQNCSYTCHLECERKVQLDCNQRNRKPEQTPSPRSHCSSTVSQHNQNDAEEDERRTKDLSEEELQTRIEEYNAQVSKNGMKLASDRSYTGFIKVHLRLSRPVTVPTVEGSEEMSRQTCSENQVLSESTEETDYLQSDKRTSFYLPCDCVKQLHISSLTTTREVIQGLLKKFMVLDNPRKFALYRQTHRHGQDLFQKLPLCERPLLLRLITGPDPEQLSFVLKENETGEVEWHAFSVPELQNFLVILEKEEAERVRVVEQKYAMYRKKLQRALHPHDP